MQQTSSGSNLPASSVNKIQTPALLTNCLTEPSLYSKWCVNLDKIILFRDILLHLNSQLMIGSSWWNNHQLKQNTWYPSITSTLGLRPLWSTMLRANDQCRTQWTKSSTGGWEPILCLTCVMLTANLWVDMGLVNGAMGTVLAICSRNGQEPPHLPIAITILTKVPH